MRYDEKSKLLRPGTTLVMYTDGLIEARGVPIEEAIDNLLAFAEDLVDLSPKAVCDEILAWRLKGGQREDDICILAVRLA